MASIPSHGSPLANAIPQLIEDVNMRAEPSHRASQLPSPAAEHRFRNG